jgi:hypothetical protein
VPLRPLALGDILSGTFNLIRKNPAATIGLAALGTLCGAILAIFFSWIAGSADVGEIPAFVLDAAVGGGVVAALGRAFLGQKISIRQAVELSRLGWVIVSGLIYWLIIGIVWLVPLWALHGFGILIAFPLGAWLGIMLSLTFPVVVLERQNSIAAISRSWQLVKGSFWRFLGIFALLIIVMVILYVIALIIITVAGIAGVAVLHGNTALAGGAAIGGIIALAVLYFLMASVVTALWTAVIVLLYADVRMRKEGMDLILQQAVQNNALTGDEFSTNIPARTSAPAGGGNASGGPGSYFGGGSGGTAGGYPGGAPGGYSGGGSGGTAGGYPGGAPGGYPGGYSGGAPGGYPGGGQSDDPGGYPGYPGSSASPGYPGDATPGGFSGSPPA